MSPSSLLLEETKQHQDADFESKYLEETVTNFDSKYLDESSRVVSDA